MISLMRANRQRRWVFIQYVRKIFQKTNISYPLISTLRSAYQGIRNVIFSENFAYVLMNDPVSISFNLTIITLYLINEGSIEY